MDGTRQGSGSLLGGQPEHLHGQQDMRRMPRRNNWMPSSDEALVEILLQECSQYSTCGGSFKPEAWVRVWKTYIQKTNEDITTVQLKGRWKTLKKLYRLYATLANKSGWSWDVDNHRPTPGCPSVWEEIIQFNKEYKVCRDKPFPLFSQINQLVASSTAMGKYARHTGGPVGVEDIPFEVEELTDSTDGNTQEVEHDPVPVQREGKNIADEDHGASGSKRKQAQGISSSGTKKKSSDKALDAVNELVALSDRRSRITEQRSRFEEKYSFEKCMEKLNAMEDISDEEAYAAIEALKSRENRVVFLTMRTSIIDFWFKQQLIKFRGQGN